ncbi:DUF1028 domain-containing protein [Cellulomonas aerilata]|uniref:Uncharacterized protein n=1 Tax=Cellulomonas aerilata TaxID=515326 RepID=A0A512DDP7_9CELL|nr:DUF1028 domain-containing protein [Cellulomonas aerilata]GEO34593.1 hypothetical protein CAE01nite_23180 [Cellulomonas aerilata]
MTFSLVARDDDGRTFGAATASKYLAVGATVPAVAAGVGALVTQAHTNVLYREAGLAMLRDGRTAVRTVELLVADDPGRDLRQVAVVAASGAPAAWTGRGCSAVAGHVVGDSCVAVGNLLTGADVLVAMTTAFEATTGTLARRLLAGLAAGDAAGGDRRGRQSAALVVAAGEGVVHLRTPARVDLRVDDHPAPVAELTRLLGRHETLVGEPDPDSALPLRGETAAEVEALLAALPAVLVPDRGPSRGPTRDPDPLPDRLAAWARTENLEHRVLPEAVDRRLLDELRGQVRGVVAGAP